MLQIFFVLPLHSPWSFWPNQSCIYLSQVFASFGIAGDLSTCDRPPVRILLVELLNEVNKDVQAAHTSTRGTALLAGRDRLPVDLSKFGNVQFDVKGRRLAQAVTDTMDLDLDKDAPRVSTRVRHAPKFLATELFNQSLYERCGKVPQELDESDQELDDYDEN